MNIIEILFLLLAGSVVVVGVFRTLRLPTMGGYLLLGVFVGPHGFGMIGTGPDAAALAELGVMALMFMLGLKFSFKRLLSSKRLVFGLGSAQVLIFLAIGTTISHYFFELSLHDSLLIAAVLTMSSTAVISKMLIDRGELDTPHGTRAVAVLIFQDLAVIPLLIILSHDPGADSISSPSYWSQIIIAVGSLSILLFLGPRVMPKLVDLVARRNSNELFTAFVLGMVVGMSLLTHKAGLSVILGAFITGILLAESHHRHLIEEIVRPYREIFLGFFFITIGLLVSPTWLFKHSGDILLLTLVLLVFKPLTITMLARLFGAHRWTAIYTGVALGGTGEFGFVLLTASSTMINQEILQIMLGTTLIGMLLPPVALPLLEQVRQRLPDDWLLQARDLTRVASSSSSFRDHVILVGSGRHALVIRSLLDRRKVRCLALELNIELIRSKDNDGHTVLYGDARNPEMLIAAGIMQAKVLVITHNVQATAIQTIQVAHNLNKKCVIIAQVLNEKYHDEATAAGASFLSHATLETGLAMGSKALHCYGFNNEAIARSLREIQGETAHIGLSNLEDTFDNEELIHLREIQITNASLLLGQPTTSINTLLDGIKVQFLTLIRNEELITITSDTTFADGDIIYLRGVRAELETAEALLINSAT